MNERQERKAADQDTQMKCECECFRLECASSFRIALEAYEAVRVSGRSFVVAPGHQTDDEPILSTTPTYLVIAKIGEEGRVAEALDPR